MMANNGVAHMAHLYGGDPPTVGGGPSSSSATRRMFDRSDSILAGEDAPFEGNATTSKFGPIQRKASNSLGTGDTLKNSLGGGGGLDLRHQAWLNSSSQAGGSSQQTSPRMAPVHHAPIGAEKKLSPSKELVNNNNNNSSGGGSGNNHQHLAVVVSDIVFSLC